MPQARAAEDPHGVWAPTDGRPITGSVADQIPKDGAECVDDAVRRAQFDISTIADSLTGGPGIQLTRYKEAFARCMVQRGWRRVDLAEFNALRVEGQLTDCQSGKKELCSPAINQMAHGIDGATLNAKRAIEVGSKLCEAGDGAVCLTVASLHLRPPPDRGLGQDPKLATKVALRGCDRGHAASCSFAGVLISTGESGDEPDLARGRRLLDLACGKGDRSACSWPDPAPAPLVETDLPDGARWCRYGTPVVTGEASCKTVAVAWVARSLDQLCEPRMSVDLGFCHYEYYLGN